MVACTGKKLIVLGSSREMGIWGARVKTHHSVEFDPQALKNCSKKSVEPLPVAGPSRKRGQTELSAMVHHLFNSILSSVFVSATRNVETKNSKK